MNAAGQAVSEPALLADPEAALAALDVALQAHAVQEPASPAATHALLLQARDALQRALALATVAAERGEMVLFGVPATKPETGYGYIRSSQDALLPEGVARVAQFVEKPDEKRANEFVRAGLLRRIDGLGSARYDDAADDHHHFRCDGCGRLFDVEPTGTEAVAIGAGGFEVERTEILFRGRCPDCASS